MRVSFSLRNVEKWDIMRIGFVSVEENMKVEYIIGIATFVIGSGGIVAVAKSIFPNWGLKNQKKIELNTELAKDKINAIKKVIKLEQEANIIEDVNIVHPELFNVKSNNPKEDWQIKCRLLLQWYIDGIPDDLETAVYALGDFLAMKTENAEEDESITGSAPKQLYSFEQDAECIYSAFREVYGINLQTIPYMHWWEFQTLFAGLPEKTEIKQRIMYRSIDLRTIKDKDERKRIKKIQEIVALKKKNRRKMTDYEIGEMFA